MSAEARYEVVAPVGDIALEATPPSPPILDLNGKTIGEVWDYVFKGDEMFPIIRRALQRRYPDVKFVGHEVFGNVHGHDEAEAMARLPRLLEEHGCDAVIAGVGC